MKRIGSAIMIMGSMLAGTLVQAEAAKREVVSLDGTWSFLVDSPAENPGVDYGTAGLPSQMVRQVNVPHAWNAEKGLEKHTGKCWYERTFEVPASQLEKTTRLRFDAVYHDAEIYINGKKAGEHAGAGYTRFYVDVSGFLQAGTNTLRVMADNSPSKSNIPFMSSYDWANDGGITRSVHAVVTSRQAIRNIHVIAEPDGQKGDARIAVHLLNASIEDYSKAKLRATIVEENQKTSNQIHNDYLAGELKDGVFTSTLQFDSINPWHFDAPNLYKLTVQLLIDGEVTDEYSATFGFRSIKIENHRYVLNGEPIRLMGVEWMPGSNLERGMAETKADLEKNLVMMKNANCIFTRFHWQQDEQVFDWCDRNGMLVQEEIPYWGGDTMLNETLLQKGIQHLEEMTDAAFNHPSIVSWGIGNELASHDAVNVEGLSRLYKRAKALDPSRLVNYVSNQWYWGFPSEKTALPDAVALGDAMMFNEYFSTWVGLGIDAIAGKFDQVSVEYPGKALIVAEWGLCEPKFEGGDKRRVEEMGKQISIYSSKPYVAGAIYFCLNDYRTHMGEDMTYSYPQRVHGVCDVNLNPKPSYFVLKEISSPVEVAKVETVDGTVHVTLRGKTGIPSYAVRNYVLESGDRKVEIHELKPGEEKTFAIKATGRSIKIMRPTGFEAATVEL